MLCASGARFASVFCRWAVAGIRWKLKEKQQKEKINKISSFSFRLHFSKRRLLSVALRSPIFRPPITQLRSPLTADLTPHTTSSKLMWQFWMSVTMTIMMMVIMICSRMQKSRNFECHKLWNSFRWRFGWKGFLFREDLQYQIFFNS